MATAAVQDAAAYTADVALDVASSTRDVARNASHQAQNAVNRWRSLHVHLPYVCTKPKMIHVKNDV